MNAIPPHPTGGVSEASQPETHLLTQAAFAQVAAIADRIAGLSIPSSKRTMVQSRLARRLRETGFIDFESYISFLGGPSGKAEIPAFISSLTTNVSHFFREQHHFESFRSAVLPGLLAEARAGRPIRIWSAGCSSGQEPYSLAMTVLDADLAAARYNFRILATDIDEAILGRAISGRYTVAQSEGMSPQARQRWTDLSPDGTEYRMKDAVRQLVTFRRLNLIEPWPMKGPFDVVFCRNVVIYFSDATQSMLWPRFATIIRPGGWFFLGHSERISDPGEIGFVSTGVTSYRRVTRSSDKKEAV